jgi:16S rRNA (cytidine1402-2'-O)-methyltransferase
MAEPILHIIATPIGNKQDMTQRAIECLQKLEIFFVEDTRQFLSLLQLYGISAKGKKIYSYASHNLKSSTEKALSILREGTDIGLTSDRGTPGISDPGALLVGAAREEGFPIVPIPGVSALTTLLSVSGLTESTFVNLGFLDRTKSKRMELYEKIKALSFPFCCFESPNRIRDLLTELAEVFPQGKAVIGREMTKLYESFYLIELEKFKVDTLPEKGEYALVVIPLESPQNADVLKHEIEERLLSDRDWCKVIARRHDTAVSDIYNALQKEKNKTR